ncbi:MAG: ankyrin repeat domain-containing protein, partial [Planctomycetota bacterium]
MGTPLTRRHFAGSAAAIALAATQLAQGDEQDTEEPAPGPVEQEFARDYPAPKFQARWTHPQLNRSMVYDFVVFAHSDLDMVQQLLDREPQLVNAAMDWGNGDWETALGGASHMGRRDIAELLIRHGARMDIFCATMLGMLEPVKQMLSTYPDQIDLRGPHSTPERNKFNLHWHA